jgi:sulfur carrier protein ThiS
MDDTIVICVIPHAIVRKLVEGEDPIGLSLPAGATVGDVPEALGFPKMALIFSHNGKIAAGQDILKEGDRLENFPAIAGG